MNTGNIAIYKNEDGSTVRNFRTAQKAKHENMLSTKTVDKTVNSKKKLIILVG